MNRKYSLKDLLINTDDPPPLADGTYFDDFEASVRILAGLKFEMTSEYLGDHISTLHFEPAVKKQKTDAIFSITQFEDPTDLTSPEKIAPNPPSPASQVSWEYKTPENKYETRYMDIVLQRRKGDASYLYFKPLTRDSAPSGTACEKHKKWKKRCPEWCQGRKQPRYRFSNTELTLIGFTSEFQPNAE
jgi:hypothetical protein